MPSAVAWLREKFRRRPNLATPAAKTWLCNNSRVRPPCPEAMSPLKIQEMAFGCINCDTFHKFTDFTEDERFVVTTNPWKAGLRCKRPLHGDHVLTPHCPGCGEVIDENTSTPPIGIFGHPYSAKTVTLAALAMEMDLHFYAGLGILKDHLFNRGNYYNEVVSPFAIEGKIPSKTTFDNHRRIVYLLYRQSADGALARLLSLTDMAGEIYDLWTKLEQDPTRQKMRAMMLKTQESMFLAEPWSLPSLGSITPADDFLGEQAVWDEYRRAGVLFDRTGEETRLLLRLLQGSLRGGQFPVATYEAAYSDLARELAGHVGKSGTLSQSIEQRLRSVKKQLDGRRPLKDQISEMSKLMTNNGYPKEGKRLKHRIALTITKADTIPGMSLRREPFPAGINNKTSPRQWHQVLNRVSSEAEGILEKTKDGRELIDYVKSKFTEVGFFFISSQGRKTETVIVEQQVNSSLQSAQADLPAHLQGAVQSTPVTSGRDWTLEKIISSEGGCHTPRPQQVLDPLLWLLT